MANKIILQEKYLTFIHVVVISWIYINSANKYHYPLKNVIYALLQVSMYKAMLNNKHIDLYLFTYAPSTFSPQVKENSKWSYNKLIILRIPPIQYIFQMPQD